MICEENSCLFRTRPDPDIINVSNAFSESLRLFIGSFIESFIDSFIVSFKISLTRSFRYRLLDYSVSLLLLFLKMSSEQRLSGFYNIHPFDTKRKKTFAAFLSAVKVFPIWTNPITNLMKLFSNLIATRYRE